MGGLIFLLAIICIFFSVLAAESTTKKKRKSSSKASSAPKLPLRKDFTETALPPNDYTVFDTETTGLDACTCEVLEIGAIRYRDHKEVKRFHSYIQPVGPLHKGAASVNGIRWADVQNAPPFSEVYKNFIEFIGEDPLVGYNIGFDVKFIQTRSGTSLKNSCFDVLPLAKRFVDAEDYKLVTVKEHFGISSISHTALGDCEATAAVYEQILQMPGVREDLHEKAARQKAREESQREQSWYGTRHFQLWEMGEHARVDGNIEKALEFFDQARALCGDGSMPFLYESYAKVYRKCKDYEKEIAILSEAVKVCPINDALNFNNRKKRAEELLASQQKREEEERQRTERRAAREERRRLELETQKTKALSVRRVIQMDDSGVVIQVFPSVSAAAQEIGIDPKGIRSAAKGTQKHAGGFCWKYADEPSPNPQAPADLTVSELDT